MNLYGDLPETLVVPEEIKLADSNDFEVACQNLCCKGTEKRPEWFVLQYSKSIVASTSGSVESVQAIVAQD